MKSQKVIPERIGGEIENSDLAPRRDADTAVLDLVDAQFCLRQQGR
jgi:hypothetical protein